MNTVQFLSHLRRINVKLWVEGVNGVPAQEARLRYSAPQGILTPALKAKLRERKAEIIDFLCQNTATFATCQPLLPTSRDAKLPLSFAQQ